MHPTVHEARRAKQSSLQVKDKHSSNYRLLRSREKKGPWCKAMVLSLHIYGSCRDVGMDKCHCNSLAYSPAEIYCEVCMYIPISKI